MPGHDDAGGSSQSSGLRKRSQGVLSLSQRKTVLISKFILTVRLHLAGQILKAKVREGEEHYLFEG